MIIVLIMSVFRRATFLCFVLQFTFRVGTDRRGRVSWKHRRDIKIDIHTPIQHIHSTINYTNLSWMIVWVKLRLMCLFPRCFFLFPCPNIWFRRRSIKMVGQHKCAMARKAVIRYTTISETLMMGKIEISSTAWFVSLNRDKKSRILVHWSLSHD